MSPPRNILAILDPFHGPQGPYNFRKDTSHLLLLTLQSRHHEIFYATPGSLSYRDGGVWAWTSPARVLESDPYFRLEQEQTLRAETFSLILMRKDPPVDLDFLHATQLLSLIEDRVPIVNSPQALRDWNEKLVILQFPELVPKTLVSSNPREIESFVAERPSLLKPLEGFAGKGVRLLNPSDHRSVVEEETLHGTRSVMIQEYLSEIAEGEKRVFLIDGHPLGALLKIPPSGSFVTNPDLGARLASTDLTREEKKVCEALAPFLVRNSIFFAGIDLIAGKLTDLNLTSPGLVWEWNEVDKKRHDLEIVEALERRMRQ